MLFLDTRSIEHSTRIYMRRRKNAHRTKCRKWILRKIVSIACTLFDRSSADMIFFFTSSLGDQLFHWNHSFSTGNLIRKNSDDLLIAFNEKWGRIFEFVSLHYKLTWKYECFGYDVNSTKYVNSSHSINML